MARVLRIETCDECPHLWWTTADVMRCRHPGMPRRDPAWPAVISDRSKGLGIDHRSQVHPACPLPEAEEVRDE